MKILLVKKAREQLAALDPTTQKRIIKKLRIIESGGNPVLKKLINHELYRLPFPLSVNFKLYSRESLPQR